MNTQTCRSCGHSASGKYCSNCGQLNDVKRISLKSLLHDVFHFFTHLEKGFWYTFKQLAVAPGTMQRQYVEGARGRHQKPFSMFFICASVNGLLRYWLYHAIDDNGSADFYHEYMILTFILLSPAYILINWLFFYREKYNYAETGVLDLYFLSFIMLMAIPISTLKLIWTGMDTAWIELPVYVVYNIFTFLNFYKTSNRLLVIVKSIIVIFLIFMLVQLAEDWIIEAFVKK